MNTYLFWRRIGFVLVLILLSGGCANPSAGGRREINVGGKKIWYTWVICNAPIRYDGYDLVIEGLEVPQEGGKVNEYLSFNVAKIGMKPTVLRQITDYTQRFKILADQMCQNRVIFAENPEIAERYALHSDALLAQFIRVAGDLQNAKDEASAELIVSEGTKKMEAISADSNPSTNTTPLLEDGNGIGQDLGVDRNSTMIGTAAVERRSRQRTEHERALEGN